MNNQNFHPTQTEPPIAHALHHFDEATNTLRYEYNGVDIITIAAPGAGKLGFRHGSDGSMQSIQYLQQIYLEPEKPATATITFRLTADAVNMRPHRAKSGQAILGQQGRPLISGVGGLYDVNWDLLLDWHGAPWEWCTPEMEEDEQSNCTARAVLHLADKPFYLNLRPQYYRKHLGYSYHKPWQHKPKQQAVAGWCSWEAYRRDIDIAKIEQIAAFMEKRLRSYGLTYIQMDDGYQQMPLPANAGGTMAEGWLTCRQERFPQGHSSVVRAIKGHGMRPAVWTNANITNPDFPTHNPDAILWHSEKPLKGEWIDFIYNCTPETLERHVTPLFRAFTELGYEYVKIDAIRHLLFDGLHECVRLGMMDNDTAEQKFRAYMQATRDGLGEDAYYLASWGEMGEVVGIADACRISMDANPTWAGIRMQLFESARWFHTQRILFLNDPDHVCVRTKLDWAKTVLSLISLSGGLYMLSDTPDAYTDQKLEVVRKTLPPLTTRTAETGMLAADFPAYTWTKLHGFAVQSHETPVEMEDVSLADALSMAGEFPTMHDAHPFSSLWAFHLRQAGRGWCVLARVATMPLEAATLDVAVLGLERGKEYLAFDFWQQAFLGTVSGELACKALAIGQCQIVALYENTGCPQLIASSRHVSMDAVSVRGHSWGEHTLTLALDGVRGTQENYFVYLPQNYALAGLSVSGGTVAHTTVNSCLQLRVSFEAEQLSLTLRF